MLRDRQELLAHYGVDTEERLSRLFYKSTECGAWAQFEERDLVVKTEPQTWVAQLQLGISGVFVHWAKQVVGPRLLPDNLPEEVRFFLQLKDAGYKADLEKEDFEQLSEANMTIIPTGSITKVVVFNVDFHTKKKTDGVMFGSIVEGCDVDCRSHWLPFPVSPADIDKIIQEIEDEADYLWQLANGEQEE